MPPDASEVFDASPRSDERLRPNLPSTQTVMTPAPMMSRTALMIWTQVVPFMPPIEDVEEHDHADDDDDERAVRRHP